MRDVSQKCSRARGVGWSAVGAPLLRRALSAAVEPLERRELLAGDYVAATEVEPNDFPAIATLLPLGFDEGEATQLRVNGSFADRSLDYYSLQLNPGDILAVQGKNFSDLSLLDSRGVELIGATDSGISSIGRSEVLPVDSPIRLQPGRGNAWLAWVADTQGTYYVFPAGGQGLYEFDIEVHRPAIEAETIGTKQILFLDFNGATINNTRFVEPGLLDLPQTVGFANLSPLETFLPNWGLTLEDENSVISAIVATVEENFNDLRSKGKNGNYGSSGIPGQYDIEILNSRDHLDPFGLPNVSRVIVGGTISEFGIATIGIAESVDVGNFDREESAVVLLDLLSDPGGDVSLNNVPLDNSVSIIDLIGVAVGNIVTHEAGHFLGGWHTDQFNITPNLMDQGGNLYFTIIGTGPDLVFGTDDDVDVDFVSDRFVPNEGFTGKENTLDSLAFALSTGTVTLPQISGLKWNDLDGDGAQDAGEPGLAGWTIYVDLNQNGIRDGSEPSATTAANGSWSITADLAFGTYVVAEVLQAGWTPTVPASGTQSVSFGPGDVITGINFGNKQIPGSVSGLKWNDRDADGVYEPGSGETGLANFYIYIDLNRDGVPGLEEPGAITGADGRYKITGVPVGTQIVREAFSETTIQTFPGGFHTVSVQPGVEVTGINFGNQVSFGVTANDDAFSVPEDSTSNSLDVLANDSTTVGALTVTEVGTASAGGSVSIATGGAGVVYTPRSNFFGTETFTYTASNGQGGTDQATVTVTVTPANDQPTAVDDQFLVVRGTTDNPLDVLANDSAAPDQGETLTITNVGDPSAGGSVTIAQNGTILLYTPAAGFLGVESFSYTISDGNGGTDQALVTVQVQPSLELLTFRLETTDPQGTPISSVGRGEQFLLNVYVEDQRALPQGAFAAYLDVLYSTGFVSVAGPLAFGPEYPNDQSGGTAVAGLIDEGGATDGFTPLGGGEFLLFSAPFFAENVGRVTFSGDPADQLPVHDVLLFGFEDAVAPERILYGTTAIDIVSLTLTAVDDQFDVNEDSTGNLLDVLANDRLGPGGGTLQISGTGPTSAGGSVEIVGGTQLRYTPQENFFGTETFTYTISDGLGGTDQALVMVNVVQQNDPPMAVDDMFTVDAGTSDNLLDVLENDSIAPDVNETLVIVDVGPTSAGGAVEIVLAGTMLSYAPAAGFSGQETFNYTISDGQGGMSQALVTVEVVAPEKLVRLRLEVADLEGTPIDSVEVGQSFVLRTWVQDLRDEPEGAFAAYLDVTYDPQLASANAAQVTPGPIYPNSPAGSATTPGLIDEAGGADGLGLPAGTQGNEFLLFTIQMTANAVGQIEFTGDSADLSPAHDIVLFGLDQPVDDGLVEFAGTTVEVVNMSFTNFANPLDVNDDGSVSPIDALLVINDMNRNGSRSLTGLAAASASAPADSPALPSYYVDVNRDGSVSPIDALLVINELNRRSRVTPITAQNPAAGQQGQPGGGSTGPVHLAPSGQSATGSGSTALADAPVEVSAGGSATGGTLGRSSAADPAHEELLYGGSSRGVDEALDLIAADVRVAWDT